MLLLRYGSGSDQTLMRSVLLTAGDNHFLYSHQTTVANGNGVKVKTFEEIMQEKRLRKQELEEQAKGPAEAEPLQNQTAERTLKRKAPARDSSSRTPKLPVRKLISLRSKSASSSVTRADSQNPNSSKENPDHQSKTCNNVKQVGAAEEPEPADPKGTDT